MVGRSIRTDKQNVELALRMFDAGIIKSPCQNDYKKF